MKRLLHRAGDEIGLTEIPIDPDEEVLIRATVSRYRKTGRWTDWLGIGGASGRTTVTNRRVIFRASRDVSSFYLLRPPKELDSIEFNLSDVEGVRIRLFPLHPTTIDWTLAAGRTVRFVSQFRETWPGVVEHVAQMLSLSEKGRA
jgi:hypothetical protein